VPVPVLAMHQDLGLLQSRCHPDNASRIDPHSLLKLAELVLVGPALSVVWYLIVHVPHALVLAPVLDGQAQLKALHRISEAVIL